MHAAGLATMAYYYFDFRDVKKQDCNGLLSSLVLQLSAESDPCSDVLSKLYSDNSRGMQRPDIGALKKCLADMLSLPAEDSDKAKFISLSTLLTNAPISRGRHPLVRMFWNSLKKLPI